MKKASLVMLTFLSSAATNIYPQTVHTEKKDVYQQNNIMFYGYDFTGFQLADYKRMEQDLKTYIFSCIVFQKDNLSEKKLAKWLEKGVVTYDFEPTINENKKINQNDIGAVSRRSLPKDSVQAFINKYRLKEKEGIGLVIIFECFDNEREMVTGYYAFFDIATKKVLLCEYVASKDKNSYNHIKDWSGAALIATKKMTDAYLKSKKGDWH